MNTLQDIKSIKITGVLKYGFCLCQLGWVMLSANHPISMPLLIKINQWGRAYSLPPTHSLDIKKGQKMLFLVKLKMASSSAFFVQCTRHSIIIKFMSRRIYLCTAGWHTSHTSFLISVAEYPYYDSPKAEF
jgi:hypothetical protein